jgi:hypothetical protein
MQKNAKERSAGAEWEQPRGALSTPRRFCKNGKAKDLVKYARRRRQGRRTGGAGASETHEMVAWN